MIVIHRHVTPTTGPITKPSCDRPVMNALTGLNKPMNSSMPPPAKIIILVGKKDGPGLLERGLHLYIVY